MIGKRVKFLGDSEKQWSLVDNRTIFTSAGVVCSVCECSVRDI